MTHPAPDVAHDSEASRRLLRGARLKRGLSEGGLASALGAAPATVERWERLGTVPQRRFRENLARVLSVDIERFEEVWGLRPRPLPSSDATIIEISRPEPSRALRSDDDPEERRFLEATLIGLEKGYASSRWWVAAAVATARSIGVEWEPPISPDPGPFSGE